jgi:uncharacterized protein involved in exopolysaccharide biosynthesis
MTPGDALRFLKEERVLVIAIIALTIIGAVAAGRFMPPDTVATAQVRVYGDARSTSLLGLDDPDAEPDHDVLMETHVRLAMSPTIAQRVIDRLGLSETTKTILERVTITSLGRSTILSFEAAAPDAESAKALADTWVSEYLAWSSETAAADLSAASSALAPRITAAEQRLDEVEARIKTGGHTRQIDTALSAAATDYEQLLADSARLQVLASVDAPPLSVVCDAVADERSMTLTLVIDGLKGFVAGAFLAVVLAFLRRRPASAPQPD